MQTRQLDNTDLRITPLGLGTWALGGAGWDYAWGDQDDRESIAAIHRAVELGINWLDTAAVYGLGHSEEVVARALKELGPSRRPYVFTKCSLLRDAHGQPVHSLKRDSIWREIEGSLRRLEVDAIDLYQIHRPMLPPDGPAPDIEEGWSTLHDLQKEGKVRWIGVSNFDVAQLKRIEPIAPVNSLQPPYSIVRPEIEKEILPHCLERNIGVIVYSPMQCGLLSGKMTRERIAALPANDWRRTKAPHFQEPNLTRNLQIVERLKEIGRRHGRSAGEVAIAWTLRHMAVTGAIVGARRPQQVDEWIGAAEFRLSEAEIAEIAAGASAGATR